MGKPIKQGLTTEELAEKVINEIEKMSKTEKAKLRASLMSSNNPVLEYMLKHHIPLTVHNYISLNWCGGEVSKLDDLGEEDYAEVQELVERNLLVDSESEFIN